MAKILSPGQIPEPAFVPVEDEAWKENLNIRQMCKECQEWPPNLVEEFSSGDMVCETCGLVIGGRIVDTRSEWRTFANDESGGDDPSRVGNAANPLLDGAQLETSISYGDGGKGSRELNRTHNKMNQDKSQKTLKESFAKISTICSHLHVVDNVTEVTQQLFKAADESKAFKGKNPDAMIAGCLFIACRQTGFPRTFREINTVTHVSKKEIGRIFKVLNAFFSKQKMLKNGTKISGGATLNEVGQSFQQKDATRATALCERYCNQLIMSHQSTNVSKTLAEKLYTVGSLAGRSPLSAAAACIYMASHLMGNPKTPKEIGAVAGVSDGTIRNAYKLIYPEKDKLIDPAWLGEGKGDLKRLPAA